MLHFKWTDPSDHRCWFTREHEASSAMRSGKLAVLGTIPHKTSEQRVARFVYMCAERTVCPHTFWQLHNSAVQVTELIFPKNDVCPGAPSAPSWSLQMRLSQRPPHAQVCVADRDWPTRSPPSFISSRAWSLFSLKISASAVHTKEMVRNLCDTS